MNNAMKFLLTTLKITIDDNVGFYNFVNRI